MNTYDGAQRKTALAMWGAVGSLGVAAGVLLGGAITTWTSWQFIFWVNGPVGLVALVAGSRIIAKDPAARPTLGAFDLPAAAAVIGGLASLVYGLGGTATHGWWSVPTVVAFAVSVGFLVTFLKLEQRAARPLFPPHVWKLNSLVSGTAVMLGVTGILVGTVFLTSIFLQTVLGFSALRTGLAFLPFALAITAGTVVARHLLAHLSPRAIATTGLLITVGGRAGPVHRHQRCGLRRRHPARTGCSRPRRRPGLRARLGVVDGRHPVLARRRGLRVPDDRARDRRRSRCRGPLRGRQHGRQPHHLRRRSRRLLARLPRRRGDGWTGRGLRPPADARDPRHRQGALHLH